MKAFSTAVLAMFLAFSVMAAETLLPQRVLYIGDREADFGPFLKKHFTAVECIPLSTNSVTPAKVRDFDVVMLDWPQSETARDARLAGSPLGARENWNKPTVLVGSAGLNLAVTWKIKGGSGCTCLAPVAYNLREHAIFKSPIPIDITGTTNIPAPTPFAAELKTNIIPVLPLVDGIQKFHSVIDDYARGWATHYEFKDLPEIEVFSGGINEQTPKSVAYWRQGNLLHFGFQQSPVELNNVGRAMLVNAVAYISRFTEDRPIDFTVSVFSDEKTSTSRDRVKCYIRSYPGELTNVLSPTALASFDRNDIKAAEAWFDASRKWLSPNSEHLLEIDTRDKEFGVPFDSAEFLPKVIQALHGEKTKAAAAALLARYVFNPPSATATSDDWDKWWRGNSAYVFYSEYGGYRWYIDPLAKKRGIPTTKLRGPARASVK